MGEYIIPVVLVAIIAAITYRSVTTRVTIMEYQQGLKYVNGRYVGLLSPGRYVFLRRTTTVTRVDIRPSAICVPGQEVLSADGLSVRASLVVNYRIADPDVAINQTENYSESLYLAIQVALRQVIGGKSLEDLLAQRKEMTDQLTELARPAVESLGLELIAADLRDITLPGELKKAFSQVVRARQEGLAALERARGETAALRSLANAARMIERSPGMLPLRMIHAIGQSTGNTYVVGLPSATMPIPIEAGEPAELPGEREPGGEA